MCGLAAVCCLASIISLCAKEHYSCCHSRCSQASEGVTPCNSDLNKHWRWGCDWLVSGGFCNGKSCSTGFVGGQVASKPSAVIMSLVFLIGKSFPRPQAHSIGKVYAGLGLPCSLWHIGGTTDDLKPLKCNFSIISFMLQGYKDYVWLCFLPTRTQKASCNESSFAKSSHYCRENAWKCHWTSTERQQQHATASMTGWDADDSMDIDLDVCFSMTDKIEKAMTYDLKYCRSCMEVVW